MKIGYIIRDNGACGYYRLSLPLLTAGEKGKVEVSYFEKGDRAEKILKVLDKANVMVIPRIGEDAFLQQIKKIQDTGTKVVIDHDDNMFCISPLSPHYEFTGTENMSYALPSGEVIPIWEDGKNFSIKENINRCEVFKEAMRQADMVTVTTDILADIYREYNSNVKVLPNCVDMNIWQRLPLLPHKGTRVAWFGGSSHYEDWCLLTDILPVIMQKYPEVTLVLFGMKFDATLKKCPQDRIEFHKWVATEAYPYKAAILDVDIAIIPLRDTLFDRCKSPIKWVEMGALSVPCVTSCVSPYKEIMTEDNGIFIEDNDPEAWVEGISLLIENVALRQRTGNMAYQYVADHFDINKEYYRWLDAYKEIA